LKSKNKKNPFKTGPYWKKIASLTQQGALEEARALMRSLDFEKSDPADLAACLFFYGVALVRVSKYAQAHRSFGQLLQLDKKNSTPWTRFFGHQAFAFWNFYLGDFPTGLKHSSRAIETSFATSEPLFSLLAHDLAGHLSMAIGDVGPGFLRFEEARKIALAAGHSNFLKAIDVSELKFRAAFGIDPATSLPSLERAVSSLKLDDVYSFAELGLELARQWVLRGRTEEAKHLLDRVCDRVYRFNVRRQVFAVNFRYALLQHLGGDRFQALNLLQVSIQGLDPKIDTARKLQAEGLRARVLGEIQESTERGCYPHSRIVHRQLHEYPFARGQDPLGDLIDDLHKQDPTALARAIDQGYLGLVVQHTINSERLQKKSTSLILDLVPGSLIGVAQGNAQLLTRKLDGQLRKLLGELENGWRSKEDLIRDVWGYDYHPLRHDPLVYNAIASLRKVLGTWSGTLETGERGYRIAEQAQVLRMGSSASPNLEPTGSPQTNQHAKLAEKSFNHRQILILEHLQKERFLSVSECARLCGSSIPTACRDLSALRQTGFVLRIGQTRSTRYQLTKGSSLETYPT
jgi:tetratricopeptide (TPR) repeat protein